MKIFPFVFLLFFYISCTGQDCKKLQENFSSYDEALNTIETTKFTFVDEVNTSKSSWIRNARYYSCNRKEGYFLLETSKKRYIFKGLPIAIWISFKKADSFGKYYHQFIRGRYRLVLEE